jgi:O-antigen ligase
LCHLALFLLVADQLRTSAQIERLLAAITWAARQCDSCCQAPLRPTDLQVEGSPVISTLGRSNFVGAYLVLVLPITLACVGQARGKILRLAYIGLMVAQLVCLAATMSRAAWLGTLAAGGVLLLAVAWNRGHRRLVTFAAGISLVGMLGGLIALACVLGLTGSVGARTTIWQATWPLIAARPLLGYGPETFGQVFTTVFPPELVYLQGRAVLVDRAHNLILDTLFSTGGAGLLAYVALIGTTLVAGMRTFIKSQSWQVRMVLGLPGLQRRTSVRHNQFSGDDDGRFRIMLGVLVGAGLNPFITAGAQDKRADPGRLFAVLLLVR